ncbi:MAG: hypothetical protein FWD97_01660 [Defluviitaleaceae bacterium]|nr:hypothetical protein [Defluviitaleaceae bacterium]
MEVVSTEAIPTTVLQIQLPPTSTPPTQSRTELKLGRKVFRVAIKSDPTATNNKTLNDCLTGFLKQRISAYLSNPKDPAGIWLSNHRANSEVIHGVNHEVNSKIISKVNHAVIPKYNLTNDSHPNQTQQRPPQNKPKPRSPPHPSTPQP